MLEKTLAIACIGLGLAVSGCSSAQMNKVRNQALIQASRKGDVKKVEILIRDGADINAVDREGWTPYLAASTEGNWAVMRVLQDHGCKTDPGF